MKLKILSILIVLTFLFSSFIVSANFKLKEKFVESSEESDIVNIRVALYTDEVENEVFYGPYKRTCYFVYALRDYSWKVDNISYKIKVDILSSKDIFSGKLTTDNYDVLLYPPDQVLERESWKHKLESKMIKNFIESGGGYFGTCAGSIVIGDLDNEPDTAFERSWKKCVLDISPINVNFNAAYPLFCELKGGNPEDVGVVYAYYGYSGWNQTNMNLNYHSGYCLDVSVNKQNPIFDDYNSDFRRIRFVGGHSILVPEQTDTDITVLASFPEQEISDNESTRIHYWSYNGGIKGMIKSLFYNGKLYYSFFNGIMQNIFMYAGDWEKTDKVVETNLAGQPCMTAEIYANENQARIVRCTGHPEHNVWWGGHIVEEDTDFDNIYEAFYHWEDIIPENETAEDEFSYNYWIIRRSIAWVSQKVSDDDLPSVYGPSQVCDFEMNMTDSEFTVKGNSKSDDGNLSLDLYYRYSEDNLNWSEWTLFSTDDNESNGWSWDFNSPNGSGYYQFYSIRKLECEGTIETEDVPPGPDASVFVEEE